MGKLRLVYAYPKRYNPSKVGTSPHLRPWPLGWRFGYPANDPENGPAFWQYERLLHWLDLCSQGMRDSLLRDLEWGAGNTLIERPPNRTVRWMPVRGDINPDGSCLVHPELQADECPCGPGRREHFVFILEPQDLKRVIGRANKHRLYTRCPSCGLEIPVGRAGQHVYGKSASGSVRCQGSACRTTLERRAKACETAARLTERYSREYQNEHNGAEADTDAYWLIVERAEAEAKKRWGLGDAEPMGPTTEDVNRRGFGW